jgi:hypothetical protein
MVAKRGRTDIALVFLNLGARWGGWSTPRPGRFTPGKDLVSIVWETGWAPGPVWRGAENLDPTGIRSPNRSESRYTAYAIPAQYPLRKKYRTHPPPTPTAGAVTKQQYTDSLPRSCFILDRASSSIPVHCPEFSWRLHSVIGSGD